MIKSRECHNSRRRRSSRFRCGPMTMSQSSGSVCSISASVIAGFNIFIIMFLIPCDCPAKAFLEVCTGVKTKQPLGPADIQSATWLSIGLARVPAQLTFKAGQARDHLGQIFDGNFVTGTQVDW